MANFFNILREGGIVFTYSTVILLFVMVYLFVKGLFIPNNEKTISLIKSISWFTVAWGFLGRTIGLISAFNAVEAAGDVSPRLIAGGLKVSLINPLLALLVFLIARIFIIVLIARKKEKSE